MTLTAMLAADRDALACDLWEVYGVKDMEALQVRDLAMLSCGLRENSRIKTVMSGLPCDINALMLAGCFDILAGIRQLLSKGSQAPKSMVKALLGMDEPDQATKIVSYATPEQWEAERQRILMKIGGDSKECN